MHVATNGPLTCSGDDEEEDDPITLGKATTMSPAAAVSIASAAGTITTAAVATATAAPAAGDKFSAPFSTPESSDKGRGFTSLTCGAQCRIEPFHLMGLGFSQSAHSEA